MIGIIETLYDVIICTEMLTFICKFEHVGNEPMETMALYGTSASLVLRHNRHCFCSSFSFCTLLTIPY